MSNKEDRYPTMIHLFPSEHDGEPVIAWDEIAPLPSVVPKDSAAYIRADVAEERIQELSKALAEAQEGRQEDEEDAEAEFLAMLSELEEMAEQEEREAAVTQGEINDLLAAVMEEIEKDELNADRINSIVADLKEKAGAGSPEIQWLEHLLKDLLADYSTGPSSSDQIEAIQKLQGARNGNDLDAALPPPFAKVFHSDKFGQILAVLIPGSDDGPGIHITINGSDLGLGLLGGSYTRDMEEDEDEADEFIDTLTTFMGITPDEAEAAAEQLYFAHMPTNESVQ